MLSTNNTIICNNWNDVFANLCNFFPSFSFFIFPIRSFFFLSIKLHYLVRIFLGRLVLVSLLVVMVPLLLLLVEQYQLKSDEVQKPTGSREHDKSSRVTGDWGEVIPVRISCGKRKTFQGIQFCKTWSVKNAESHFN